jgi:hypothetical protein
MNNELERIIDKVKKCIALSQSDNPNEAAAALRQAQALMRKHGLDEAGLVASEVASADVDCPSGNGARPPAWESMLVTLVGTAFGCQGMFVPGPRFNGRRAGGIYRYLGITAQASLAAHTATVLLRLLRSSRLSHAKQLRDEAKVEGWKPTKAEERSAADAFCLGWLIEVRKQVVEFANPPEIKQAIQRQLLEQTRGRTAKPASARINQFDQSSVADGCKAGGDVRLHRPVNGAAQQRALPHRAVLAGE